MPCVTVVRLRVHTWRKWGFSSSPFPHSAPIPPSDIIVGMSEHNVGGLEQRLTWYVLGKQTLNKRVAVHVLLGSLSLS